jgi:hypothetical protein
MTLVLIPSLAAVRPLLCCDVRFTPESGHFIDKLCHRFAPRLRTLAVQKSMSALHPKADICSATRHVCFTPKSGHWQRTTPCPLCAKSGLMHRSKQHLYSITSSARVSSEGGTSRPSVFAVLRLITNSNLVGCSTGRSVGLAPLRIFPVYWPAWRYAAPMLVP